MIIPIIQVILVPVVMRGRGVPISPIIIAAVVMGVGCDLADIPSTPLMPPTITAVVLRVRGDLSGIPAPMTMTTSGLCNLWGNRRATRLVVRLYGTII